MIGADHELLTNEILSQVLTNLHKNREFDINNVLYVPLDSFSLKKAIEIPRTSNYFGSNNLRITKYLEYLFRIKKVDDEFPSSTARCLRKFYWQMQTLQHTDYLAKT